MIMNAFNLEKNKKEVWSDCVEIQKENFIEEEFYHWSVTLWSVICV